MCALRGIAGLALMVWPPARIGECWCTIVCMRAREREGDSSRARDARIERSRRRASAEGEARPEHESGSRQHTGILMETAQRAEGIRRPVAMRPLARLGRLGWLSLANIPEASRWEGVVALHILWARAKP